MGTLGVAQPTVWAQVHAFELSLHALKRPLHAQLVEPHGRGCRLTGGDRPFAQLGGP